MLTQQEESELVEDTCQHIIHSCIALAQERAAEGLDTPTDLILSGLTVALVTGAKAYGISMQGLIAGFSEAAEHVYTQLEKRNSLQ